jgi:16S rRNA (cytosine967-C5)-methyltransferase
MREQGTGNREHRSTANGQTANGQTVKRSNRQTVKLSNLPASKEAGTDSRFAAATVVARWLKTGEFPDRLIADNVRDHAFVTDLVLTAVRRKRALEWILDRFVRRNPGPDVRAALLVGACQLLFMPDVADYASLSATVEAVRRLSRHQTGFANAVLRGVQREREALLKELAAAPIAIRESHPDDLVARWTASFGADETARICVVDNLPAGTTLTVLPFTESAKAEALAARLDAEGVAARVHPLEPAAIVLGHGVRVRELPGFAEGLFAVQDAAPLAALRLLAPQPGETILDACAAPGGKTLQIAASVGETGRVVAADLHEDRLAPLRENIDRCGFADRVGVSVCDAADPTALAALFPDGRRPDAVLADVPCSNTGVLRRRADARWRFGAKRLKALHDTQLAILEGIAALLPERIVYSTCSLEHEEDEDVISEFLSRNTAYRLEKSERLLPDDSPRDGAFAALLRRKKL